MSIKERVHVCARGREKKDKKKVCEQERVCKKDEERAKKGRCVYVCIYVQERESVFLCMCLGIIKFMR